MNFLIFDLDKIMTWAKRWLVRFNPVKTEAFLTSHKVLKPIHPPLFMDGTQILEVELAQTSGYHLPKGYIRHKHIVCVEKSLVQG